MRVEFDLYKELGVRRELRSLAKEVTQGNPEREWVEKNPPPLSPEGDPQPLAAGDYDFRDLTHFLVCAKRG